jgi:hypothetical protein
MVSTAAVVAGLFAVPLTAHFSPLTAQSVTIYNDGRVLVRRSVPLELAKGESAQRVALGPVEPTSIFSTDSTVTILAATYDGGTDYQSALRRAVGRKLLFRSGKDTVSATVLGVDPERYKLADGTISFSAPGMPQFPEDLVVVDPAVNLSLRAQQARKNLSLGYFTDGASWQASYQVLLGTGSARVTGMAVVSAGTLNLKDAEVQLLAGSVSRAPMDQISKIRPMAAVAAREEISAIAVEQKVGEFHLYTLPGKLTLLPGVTSSTALFDPASTPYTKTFEVHGNIPYWGGLPQYGDEEDVPVSVTYTLQRSRKTDFGDRPLPGGVVRLFEPDSGGRLQLVGESSLDHTPAGEEVRLAAGTAFDLTAKRVQTGYTTKRDSTGTGYWRTLATADYKVTLSNAGDAAVTIDVMEERGGEWSVVSSSVKPDKLSSTRTRFRVAVPARGKATLTYKVRVIW